MKTDRVYLMTLGTKLSAELDDPSIKVTPGALCLRPCYPRSLPLRLTRGQSHCYVSISDARDTC